MYCKTCASATGDDVLVECSDEEHFHKFRGQSFDILGGDSSPVLLLATLPNTSTHRSQTKLSLSTHRHSTAMFCYWRRYVKCSDEQNFTNWGGGTHHILGGDSSSGHSLYTPIQGHAWKTKLSLSTQTFDGDVLLLATMFG